MINLLHIGYVAKDYENWSVFDEDINMIVVFYGLPCILNVGKCRVNHWRLIAAVIISDPYVF